MHPRAHFARGGNVVAVMDDTGVLISEARYMPSRTVRPRAGCLPWLLLPWVRVRLVKCVLMWA